MKSRQFLRRASRLAAHRLQRGMLLIEALCAILIFSFGVLGLVGLQASTISQSSDAKLRSAAAQLADQLINQMWVSNRAALTYTTVFQPAFASGSTPGALYTAWLGSATTPGSVMATLPGVTATTNLPTVTWAPAVAGCASSGIITCTSSVTVTVNWASPHDGTVHSYTTSAQFSLY